MELIATTGEWGLNLQTGFCGFITRQGSLVDDGIEYFEKFEAGIPFVHTFILEQPGYIIEALGSGVVKQPLSKYVGDARVQCFIRAPRFWTPAKGLQYAREADRHIGEKYGYGLIVADALANTVLGRLLNKWTGGVPDSAMTWLLDERNHIICSELVAACLQTDYVLRLKGCLRGAARSIMPKRLGNDDAVFEEETVLLQGLK